MLFAYLLVIPAIAVAILILNCWKYKDLMKLPGPSYFFIFATTFNTKLTSQDIFKSLTSLNKTYGPVVKIWINPLKPVLIVSDPKYVRHLLSSNVHLDKSKFYDFFHPFVQNGIATIQARDWKIQKKIAKPGFRGKILENYMTTMDKFANKLIATLAKDIKKTSVDVSPILSMYALEVVCATIMNLEENLDEDSNLEYLKAREGFFGLFSKRMVSLLKQSDFSFRFTGSYERHRRSIKVMKDFAGKIISGYLKQTKDEPRGEHLIDYLLGVYSPNDSNLVDNIGTFLAAGHETMATVLSFTLYELATRQDIQAKIVDESYSVLGGCKCGQFSFGQLQQMKYLECVLKESMRKYTPVPFFDRRTGEEMVIDGFRIPKGTDISICAHNIHRNEEYFPDPENFLPDRFSSENDGNIKPYTYIPFSLGPRGCIGKQYGMIGMKLTLAKLLRHYEIHVADVAQKMELKSEFSLKSTIGMPVKLTLR